ncbi:MAG: RiPP maturation radical SAM C-methyltransferase [Desulforhopalus sp.]|nr:RiPP maturation radical SAM C-methyltransferase [Desulforhopalus sp.]
MTGDTSTPFRLALVSMPWPIFNRPSLQLATLKAYLEEKSTCTADCFHPYLHLAKAIGIDTYTLIARSGWAGEALFAPLVFPEMGGKAKHLFHQSIGKKHREIADFEELIELVTDSTAKWLATTDWHSYRMVGMSVCFFQTLPSLYCAAKLKERVPHLPIVFGGSSCSGAVGTSLFERFGDIDYLIDGEGEVSLLHLCRYLDGQEKTLAKEILSRQPLGLPAVSSKKIVLNDLPIPNFSPYFQEVRELFPDQVFIPVLPIEFSRGCWWNRCSFCNLNLQWPDYRTKDDDRMKEEVQSLAKTHGCLQFAFADNALPPRQADRFFTSIAAGLMDLDFFAEIRGITNQERLALYRSGGLRTVQVGIEALSVSLLKKMAKGTTVMDTIAAMKICCSSGIHLEGNIITEFPGSTPEEIAETLYNLDFVLPFAPLQAAAFFLGYGSPIHQRPRDFSIKAITPHGKNRNLFPENILRGMTMITNGYRGDRGRQRQLWKPVIKKLKKWQTFHEGRRNLALPPLYYRDGGDFLIISQEQLTGPCLQHRLRGISRRIYLFCSAPHNISAICTAFPNITKPALDKFLWDMADKRLMFREGDQVISLAIHLPNH